MTALVTSPVLSFCLYLLLSLCFFCLKVTAKSLTQHDELMKKTETMNVLMETNKMLREEKKKLEQELQDTQAKASHQKYSQQLYLLVKILLKKRNNT